MYNTRQSFEKIAAISGFVALALGATSCGSALSGTSEPSPRQQHSSAAKPASPSAQPSVETISVVTWNVSDQNQEDVANNITTLAHDTNADVMALQELYSAAWRRDLKTSLLCNSCDYNSTIKDYEKSGPVKDQNPVIWKKSEFKAIYIDRHLVHPNPSVSGKPPLDDKEMTTVTLERKQGGAQTTFIDVHPVAWAEANGRPTDDKDRTDYYGVYMDDLDSNIEAMQQKFPNAEEVPIGDWNVGDMADTKKHDPLFPAKRLGRRGMQSSFELTKYKGLSKKATTRTDGGGLMDKLYLATDGHLRVVSTKIGDDTLGSDHYPVKNRVAGRS